MAGQLRHKRFGRLTASWMGLGAIAFVLTTSISILEPVKAQDEQDLKSLRKELDEAQARKDKLEKREAELAKELKSLSKRLVKAAEDVRRNESILIEIERDMQELGEQESNYEAAFHTRRAQLSESLAALQKLSRQPPQLLLMRPASATDTARTAGLLNAVLPEVQAQAQALREELNALNTIRSQLEKKQEDQRVQLASLEAAEAELDLLRTQRARERQEIAVDVQEEAKRIEKLVRESKTLEELLTKLEAEKKRSAAKAKAQDKPKLSNPSGSISKARGKLAAPAVGPLLIAFGDRTPQGKSQGIRILTREGATIISPFDGTVMYSGEFRSYGELLIIQHSEGYHSVLAGMERLDGSVGQWVLSGEPVGEMGTAIEALKQPKNPKGQPVLYVELQRGGKAVDPLPWLSAKMERAKP